MLFAQLGNALQAVASEQFDSSRGQLAAVTIDRAHLPSGLVDMASRYVDLCNELADTVQDVYDSLQQVEELLATNDVQHAGVQLAACRALVVQAQEQLAALEDATLEMFAMLQRSGSGGTTAQLAEARQSLEAAIARLSQLTIDYASRLEVVQSVADEKRGLAQPVIRLFLGNDAAWVGERVALSGTAGVGGSPLADREMLILMDGLEVARVRSGSEGSFSYELPIPFEYVPLRVLQVSFLPVGSDLDRYRRASSNPVELTVRFHATQVTLDPYGNLYPGLAGTVGGMVVSSGRMDARQVELRCGDEIVGQTVTGAAGAFSCQVTLPSDAAEGADTLTLMVAGDDAALTAPGLVQAPIDIVRLAPSIKVSVPRVLLVPAPSMSLLRQLLGGDFVRMVPVSGDVGSALPMDLPSMSAYWGERQVHWQQQGAVFERDTPLVTSIWSMGVRSVTVRITPREPWLKPVETSAHLLVVNLFMPVVWFAALVTALALGLAARRRWVAVNPRGVGLPLASGAGSPPGFVRAENALYSVDAGMRLSLVMLYYRAVQFFQTRFDVTLRSEMTLREYLAATIRRLPATSRLFDRLTSLAEQALYGPREPRRTDVTASRRLVAALLRMRRRDSSKDEDGIQ